MTPSEIEARSTPEPMSGCWLWTGYVHRYGSVRVNGRPFGAHRASFEAFNGFLPPVVMHRCDNTACVNPAHLQAGTHEENARDRHRKGRTRNGTSQGSMRPAAKLNENDVLVILGRLRRGDGCRAIARDFGVTHGRISEIRDGKSWKHVGRADAVGSACLASPTGVVDFGEAVEESL